MLTRRSVVFRVSVAIGALAIVPAVSHAADAASYPSMPVKLVVPYPPGGPTDLTGRILAQGLSEKWHQSVIVENRPGAGGNIGSAFVAKSKPDGYTMVLGITGSHAINKWLYKDLPYDPQKDFEPASLAVVYANAILVNPSVPAKDLKELIALVKSNPGKYTYGSDGNGSASELSMELIKEHDGLKMTHVPYRGSAPLLNDLMAGVVPVGITGLPSAEPFVKSGKLRLLAITTAKDYSGNNYPTVAAQGFPGFDIPPFSGIFLPKGTPQPIVDKIAHDMVDVLNQPAAKQKMANLGLQPMPTTPQQTAAFLQKQITEWQHAVKVSGATVE